MFLIQIDRVKKMSITSPRVVEMLPLFVVAFRLTIKTKQALFLLPCAEPEAQIYMPRFFSRLIVQCVRQPFRRCSVEGAATVDRDDCANAVWKARLPTGIGAGQKAWRSP